MKSGSIVRGVGEVEHATPEQMLAHPAFPEARRIFVSEHARVYEAGVFPAQFGADAGRVTTLAIIVCHHAGYDPADRATWPTLSLLKETVARFGFASPRLIDSFVARLVQTGYLERRQHPEDSRVRLLFPTENLLAWDRAWMAAHYAALEALYPVPGFGPARHGDRAFQAAHARSAIAAFDAIIAMMWSNLEIVVFLSSTSGLIILLSLFEMGGSDPERRIREADLVQLAPRFAVSRSHVRNILTIAQERRFLVRSGPRDAYIHLTPHWVEAFDRFIAGSLAQSDLTYRLALRHLGHRPEPQRAAVGQS